MSEKDDSRNYGGCITAIFFGIFIGGLSALGSSLGTSLFIGVIAAILFSVFTGGSDL